MKRLANFFSRFVPEEWKAGWHTFTLVLSESLPGVIPKLRHLFGNGLVVSIGALVAFVIEGHWSNQGKQIDLQAIDSIVRGVLPATGILAGFMITLMLFTGKTEAWKSLSVDEADVFVRKSVYLLVSQFFTLSNHVLSIVCAISILSTCAMQMHKVVGYLFILQFALVANSIFRTGLIPLQIIELHRFALGAMLEEKRLDASKKIGAQK